jgi:pimeloyl-ACP methyl ester carboxylesterase
MTESLKVFRTESGKQKVFEVYDSIINSIGIQYHDIYLPTRLGETHIIKTGSDLNPPLILIHAYYASSASWYKNIKQLSENYKVYNIDIIGDPNKSKPIKLIRQLNDFLDWIDDLMEGLNLESSIFIGNSVGAFHILNYYLHSPKRVKKMVLIGPAATFRQIMPFYLHTFPGGITGWTLFVRHAESWVENGVRFDPDFRKLFFLLLKYGKGTNQVFPKVFSDDELKKVIVPTLLIYGERENIYNYKEALNRAQRLISNLRVRIIKNGNHITAATNYELVNKEILDFLNDYKI